MMAPEANPPLKSEDPENASLKHLSVPVSCDRVRLGGIARYAPFVGSVMLVGSGCSSHLLS